MNSNGPRAKCDQVVFEALVKAAEIIVQSRCLINKAKNASSGRFNLQIPEQEDLRALMIPWKQSLHLPLQLSIYCGNELLEQWWLSFHPGYQTNFAEECPHTDPLVQLRHVCKKVVFFLRSLYCLTRLLPCQRLHETTELKYSLEITHACQEVFQFDMKDLPPVPTPYGPMAASVWYMPTIQRFLPEFSRRKAMPIPIAAAPCGSTVPQDITKSAPSQYNFKQPHIVSSSHPNRPVLRTAHSGVDRRHTPPPLERSLSMRDDRRAVLHDPPPLESYGYAYNTNTTAAVTGIPASLSTSPGTPLGSTPPAFCHLQNGSYSKNLLPPRNTGVAPPFQAFPIALQEAPTTSFHQSQFSQAPPMTSLEMLHSSPFKSGIGGSMSTFGESDFMRGSSVYILPTAPTHDIFDEDDMPFAVDMGEADDAAVTSLAQTFAAQTKLDFIGQSAMSQQQGDLMQNLTQQLQEMKSFGASLYVEE